MSAIKFSSNSVLDFTSLACNFLFLVKFLSQQIGNIKALQSGNVPNILFTMQAEHYAASVPKGSKATISV